MTNDSTQTPLPRGIRFIIAFHVLNLVLWLVGITGSLIAYDLVAALGLVESRDSLDVAVFETNRAIALADTVFILPLIGIALYGMLQREFYGFICSWMYFGWSIYWPAVFWGQCLTYRHGNIMFPMPNAVTLSFTAFFFGFACWASWYLCQVCYNAGNVLEVYTRTTDETENCSSGVSERDPLVHRQEQN